MPEDLRKSILLVFIGMVLLSLLMLPDCGQISLGISENIEIDSFFLVENNAGITLRFSETGHFYAEDVTVWISASEPGADIFYTTDGSVPTPYSALYTVPLHFEPASEMYAVVLKAIAVYEDLITEVLTHTFFIGHEINERFGSNILVISLSADPDCLFNEEIGIFENLGGYGREWERPVNVEVFTHYGKRVMAQAAGMRIHGGWSRYTQPQKSLRLIARREYSPEAGRFHFDFFPSEFDINRMPLTKFNTLILRNGSNDFGYGQEGRILANGMIRNELGSLLAKKAGFLAVTPTQAAVVFLNGEYYGFSWLQVRIDEHYLEDIYAAPAREFDVINIAESYFETDDFVIIADLDRKNSFADKDLRDDEIFAELEALVDIENLLFYYAFHIFVGDDDFPHNNLRRWRYTGEQAPGLAPELDGRWRYAFIDLDWAFGNSGQGRNSFQLMLEGEEYEKSPFLKNILKHPDLADKFTMILCDIAANVVSGEIVAAAIDALYSDVVWDEVSSWAAKWGVSTRDIFSEHMIIKNFVANRPEYIFESLSQYFGFGMEMYTVKINGGEAIIGTQQGVSSQHFNHLEVPVRPVVPKFYEFEYWILNGERIYDEEIMISVADAHNGVAELNLVKRYRMPPLKITEMYVLPLSNGVVLANLSGETVRTDGLYLSNNAADLLMYKIPLITVRAGGIIELAGRGSKDSNDFLRLRLGFNIRESSVLYLSDETGRVLDKSVLRTGTESMDLGGSR